MQRSILLELAYSLDFIADQEHIVLLAQCAALGEVAIVWDDNAV